MKLKIVNGGAELQVSDAAFGQEFNEALVHQVVTAYRNAGRSGTKAQKTREGDLLVTSKATTYTRSGHDKRARVTIEVLAGESSIGSTVIPRIDAEENKNARGGSILYLPLDRVSGQADPELRIALEVADD